MCREIHVSDINLAVVDSFDEGYDAPRMHVEDLVVGSDNSMAWAFEFGRQTNTSESDDFANDSY